MTSSTRIDSNKMLVALYSAREAILSMYNQFDNEWAIQTWRALPFLDIVKNEEEFSTLAESTLPILINDGYIVGVTPNKSAQFYSSVRFTGRGLERAAILTKKVK